MHNRRFTLLAAAATAAAAALALAGCSGTSSDAASGSSDDGTKIAIFTTAYGLPAPKYTLDLLTSKAEDEGWDVTMFSTNDDFDKLNSDMQAAAVQGFDAFIVGYPDPRAMTVGLNAAKDAGIPVFAVDGGVEANDLYAQDVAVDQQSIADLSVEGMTDAVGDLSGKNIMVITFDPSITISTRAKLAAAEFEAAGATVVTKQIQNGASATTESLGFVKDYLQGNAGELDGIWTGLDPAALGAAQAVSESGEDVPVTGVDGMGAVLEQIAAGSPLVATVLQDWDTIAESLFASLKDYVEDGTTPAEDFVQVPGKLIDSRNVGDFTPNY